MSNALPAAALRLAVAAVTLLVPVLAHAARPVDPPSLEMTRGENNVVAATVLDKPDPTHMVVRIEALLSGAGEGRLTLRADASVIGTLVLGHRYLFAFTRLKSDDQFRDAKFIDPQGPRMLELRGLRTGAVFEDVAPMRFLFERARGEPQPGRRERLDAVMEAVQLRDRRTRAFAIEELFLRPELGEAVRPSDTAVLDRLANERNLDTQLRQYIVRAAYGFPGSADQPWLVATNRRIVATSRPYMDLTTPLPLLVVTALEGLAAHGDQADLSLMLRMLASNAPAVVVAALKAADAIDPAATLAAVEQLMERLMLRDDVHADIRRTLERYYVESQLSALGHRGG